MSASARGEWWASRPTQRPAARPDVRIGDAERSGAVEALGEHFAAGRLSYEELDERVTRALRARTAADVAPLFADLPAPYPPLRTGGPGPPSVSPSRAARRLPVLPMLLVLLGLALLLEEGAVLLFGFAAMWWWSSVRGRRTRVEWARRRHPAAARHHPC